MVSGWDKYPGPGNEYASAPPSRRTGLIVVVLLLLLAIIVATQTLTIFVIQPIGAIPEGRTVVMVRMNKSKFIDSADAMCVRETGGVSLLCRGMMMGAMAKKGTILVRLPYSEFLYSISTGGRSYDR